MMMHAHEEVHCRAAWQQHLELVTLHYITLKLFRVAPKFTFAKNNIRENK